MLFTSGILPVLLNTRQQRTAAPSARSSSGGSCFILSALYWRQIHNPATQQYFHGLVSFPYVLNRL